MKVECPFCGSSFDAKRRANGEGTRVVPGTPLSFMENQTFEFIDEQPEEVRGIQNRMIAKDIRRNYHQVQRTLSLLVGRGLVRMDTNVFPPRYYR